MCIGFVNRFHLRGTKFKLSSTQVLLPERISIELEIPSLAHPGSPVLERAMLGLGVGSRARLSALKTHAAIDVPAALAITRRSRGLSNKKT
jgi:hypothetical protein